MKKIYTILFVIALVLSCTLGVFADPSGGPGDEHNTATIIPLEF